MEKYCLYSNHWVDETQFSISNPKTGRLHVYCKSCQKEYSRQHYRRHKNVYAARSKVYNQQTIVTNRQLYREYLLRHPCIECGQTDPDILEPDHVRDKKGNVYQLIMSAYTWSTVLEELEKCQIRCGNCHAIKTSSQQQWYKYSSEVVDKRQQRLMKNNRTKVFEYLTTHFCVYCNQSNPVVLNFYHIDDKTAFVSKLMHRSWKSVLKEITKCTVLCRNCFKKQIAYDRNYWYTKVD